MWHQWQCSVDRRVDRQTEAWADTQHLAKFPVKLAVTCLTHVLYQTQHEDITVFWPGNQQWPKQVWQLSVLQLERTEIKFAFLHLSEVRLSQQKNFAYRERQIVFWSNVNNRCSLIHCWLNQNRFVTFTRCCKCQLLVCCVEYMAHIIVSVLAFRLWTY